MNKNQLKKIRLMYTKKAQCRKAIDTEEKPVEPAVQEEVVNE